MTVGATIVTLNAEGTLRDCLTPLLGAKMLDKILVVDSSSDDATVSIAREMGVEVLIIPRGSFNHGATRNVARRQLGTDIAILLTQDAFAVDAGTFERLVEPIKESRAAVCYARQLPHDQSGIFERYPREFNYGPQSQLRGMDDIAQYGVYTFFCSNSCAAWDNTALDEIGGFPSVLTNEDYFAVARLLSKGYKIAYVAQAEAKHSHRYTLLQEFQRYFDTGYVRAERPWVQEMVGNAEKRGAAYFTGLLRKLLISNPLLIPYACIQTLVKWVGFRVGFYGLRFPLWLKRTLSSQKSYWTEENMATNGHGQVHRQ
ncbi:MAG: glycosyltransferase family 2 protein [Candidatus Marinimicrobia bacterium]|nr:glycosyltransferase family 2 protein [Candidatus Neomarinimicrobiota bacterium]